MVDPYAEVMEELDRLADADRLAEMWRVGIKTQNSLGISLYDLRKLAKTCGELGAAQYRETQPFPQSIGSSSRSGDASITKSNGALDRNGCAARAE